MVNQIKFIDHFRISTGSFLLVCHGSPGLRVRIPGLALRADHGHAIWIIDISVLIYWLHWVLSAFEFLAAARAGSASWQRCLTRCTCCYWYLSLGVHAPADFPHGRLILQVELISVCMAISVDISRALCLIGRCYTDFRLVFGAWHNNWWSVFNRVPLFRGRVHYVWRQLLHHHYFCVYFLN